MNVPLEFEYRIRFNGTSNAAIVGFLNESWQYVGAASEVTVHQLNLTDGNNYTFQVRAVNTGGVVTVTVTVPVHPFAEVTVTL